MKILVTGGCGFIGSNFIEYILNNTNHNVINIDLLTYAGASLLNFDNQRYTFHNLDIGDREVAKVLEHHKPDYIVNFAAETHVDRSINNPFPFIKTNILSTYNFICMVQEYFVKNTNIKFLHISTDEVYGELSFEDMPFTENSQYAPNSPYSATKASSDHLVRAFHKTYGFPAIITNCSNNYGPRQFPEKFIPVIIRNAFEDKPIPVYGTGMNVRDWLYVTDHCEALYKILVNGKPGQKYNIGGNNEQTNLYVATTILHLLEKPISLLEYVDDRKGHDFRYAIDASYIKHTLGWQASTSFEHGLRETIEWYYNNLDWVTQCGHSV